MGDSTDSEIINRLERLEARMRVAESISRAPAISGPSAPLNGPSATELEKLVHQQSARLGSLQDRLIKAEELLARAVESRNDQLMLHEGGVPATVEHVLEDHIEGRIDEMRVQIEEDLAKLNHRTLTTIETLVDDRIAGRVELVENVVRYQAKGVDELRERFTLLEGHLQRLVTTVERLVERSGAPGREVAIAEIPTFRTYLDHAVRNDPIPPPPEVDPLFRLKIIKDDDNNNTRQPTPRRPMSPVT